MKLMKRIIAMVLCLLMISSGTVNVLATENPDIVIVENTACTSCGVEDGHAEGCPVVTPCATCGQLSCFVSHENWCATCNTENCGLTHEKCDKCLTTDCKNPHEQWCEHCRQDNCSKTHVVCDECSTVDGHLEGCTKNIPAESTKCDFCGMEGTHADRCPAVTPCATCGQLRCLVTHENWCAVCNTENCGQTHVTCDECTGVDGHNDGCSKKETTPVGCPDCGEAEGHKDTCPQYVAPVLDQLLAAETLEAMFAIIGIDENAYAVMDMNYDELTALMEHVEELYAALENPTVDDEDYYLLLKDAFGPLLVCPDCFGEMGEHTGDCSRNDSGFLDITKSDDWTATTTLTKNTRWVFGEGAVVTFKGPVTIPSGVTLTLEGWGSIARFPTKPQQNVNELFIVENGGKLIIKGSSLDKPFTIDGKNVIASKSLITSSGVLDFKNAVIQNGKNRSVYPPDHKSAGKPNGIGGGIYITTTGSLSMDSCIVTKNTASLNGGGIECRNTMTISNSTISYNRAMSSETGGINAGRGGGFNLQGRKKSETSSEIRATATLTNVLITNNAAMYYGGGGQITTNAHLVMNEGTVFSNNTAVLHGAAGLHVTNAATFTMNGGKMINNTAQTVGGAIHSSYTCTLILNAGEISGNTANGRGGGVHINTGGALTLNEKITISNNTANNQPSGSKATVDATGDNWSNVECNGAHNDNGYGGGVLIDSGTCTVAGATITNNTAAVGGGGIALVMLNVNGDSTAHLLPVNFTMTSGTISGNKSSEDGAGVYLMSNRIKELLIKTFGGENTDSYKEQVSQLKYPSYLTAIPEANVSGGTIDNNTATNNGGGLYLAEKTKFIISGTADISNNKAANGAGAYVASGTAEIHGGTMSKNEARANGGAVYVKGTVTMTDGIVSENKASSDGGAVYVSSGDITMSGGSMTKNTAANGGAAYVSGGDMTIEHGNLDNNTAYMGGAVYMAGTAATKLIMQSGTLNGNSAIDNTETSEKEGDGGAIYATGGTVYIGLEGCNGQIKDEDGNVTDENNGQHTTLGDGRHHPKITGNKAADTGGAISISKTSDGTTAGVVHFYCGNATDNEALYKGVGMNVFMDGGEFHMYDGADVGVPRDPDLIIIGGTLHNERTDEYGWITLKYYQDNTGTEGTVFTGLARVDEFMNLPEGEYFWDAPTGFRFFGWTAMGSDSSSSSQYVRNKNQYKESGSPIQINDTEEIGGPQNTFDGTPDNTIHLYALWAPETSKITYVDGLTLATFSHEPGTYSINEQEKQITITATGNAAKPGYAIAGWYIFQNPEKNANWGYEPAYLSNGNLDLENMQYYATDNLSSQTLNLTIPGLTFGDITLIANYVPAYTDLEVSKTGCTDSDQSFLFKITGNPTNDQLDDVYMTVTIQGNGKVLIKDLPVGDYLVTELTNWSWRYTPDEETKDITLSDPTVKGEVSFANTRTNKFWLSGDHVKENQFTINNGE